MRAQMWTVIKNLKDIVIAERSFTEEQWMHWTELCVAPGAKDILNAIEWNEVPKLAYPEQTLETPTWGSFLLRLFPCFQGRVKVDVQQSVY